MTVAKHKSKSEVQDSSIIQSYGNRVVLQISVNNIAIDHLDIEYAYSH